MEAILDTPRKPSARKHRASRKLHFLTKESLDGRTRARKIFDAIARGVASDLQTDQLSTIQKHLIEAFAGAAVRVHDINARLLKGEEPDILAHSQAISSLVRVASRLPVGRTPRDVTPDLKDYLAARSAEKAAREQADIVIDAADEPDEDGDTS
jgi:hypothetical protein